MEHGIISNCKRLMHDEIYKEISFDPQHRAFVTYGVLISFCIDFQRTIGFGVLRQPLHLAMVILGLFLFYVFFRKKAWNEFYYRNINHLNN